MNAFERLSELGDPREIVAKVSSFLFVFLLWCAAIWIWWLRRAARARRVTTRLGLPDANAGAARELRLWSQGEEFTTVVPNETGKVALQKRLEVWRSQARFEAPLSSLILAAVAIVIGAFLITYVLTGNLLGGAGAAVLFAMIVWAYASQKAQKGITLFETQFVDALNLASRSLRAGHPLTGAFQLASEEIAEPVGTIFREVCQQQELGLSIEDSLRRAAQLRASADLKLFSTSVIIQLESGGNLADMMDRLTTVIRDRLRLNRHARVLTAQTQLSKRILVALPFFLFMVLNLLNPGYMEPLYATTEGSYLIGFGAVSLVLGMWVMNRMVILKY
jgi:tight adherence protein B